MLKHSSAQPSRLFLLIIIAGQHLLDQLGQAGLLGLQVVGLALEFGLLAVVAGRIGSRNSLLKLPRAIVQFRLHHAQHFYFEQLESGATLGRHPRCTVGGCRRARRGLACLARRLSKRLQHALQPQ